jgi:hypothetical protein
MDRSKAVLLGFVLACVPIAISTGTGSLGMLGFAAVGAVAYAVTTSLRGRTVGDAAWAVPAGAFEFVPTVTAPTGRAGPIARALGRVESRRLLDSIAFWSGVWLGAIGVWLFGWAWSDDNGGDIGRVAESIPWIVHPFVGLLLVAVHRARTRARRDGAVELFTACPASEHQRDQAHLATAWVGAVVAVGLGVALLMTYRARADFLWGSLGARALSFVAGAALLAVGATALGVLLGRVAPWGITPVVALVVIGTAILQLNARGGETDLGVEQLSTAPVIERFDWLDSPYRVGRWVAHDVWLAALVLLVVAVLWWVGTRRRSSAFAVVFAALFVAVAGWAATRPIADADVDRIVSMIAEPDRHQDCVDVGVPVCVHEGNDVIVDAFRPHLGAVLAVLPAGAPADPITFRQGADVRIADLPDRAAVELASWTPPADVPPVKLSSEGYDAARFWLALAVAGIAGETSPDRVVDVAGEARGVVAIWAATRGVPVERAVTEMASIAAPDPHGENADEARPWPPVCLAGPTPVQWSYDDLAAARSLIALPHERVASVVQADWGRWTDPATPTADLLAALDVEPLAADERRTPVLAAC